LSRASVEVRLELLADVIISYLGLELQLFGGMQVAVDGVP
jgi:hypothetical protein